MHGNSPNKLALKGFYGIAFREDLQTNYQPGDATRQHFPFMFYKAIQCHCQTPSCKKICAEILLGSIFFIYIKRNHFQNNNFINVIREHMFHCKNCIRNLSSRPWKA